MSIRELQIKVSKISDEYVFFSIVKQTHIHKAFGPDGCNFTASNGFTISSVSSPSQSAEFPNSKIFVRGLESCSNDVTVKIRKELFGKFRIAIKEYNELDKPDDSDSLRPIKFNNIEVNQKFIVILNNKLVLFKKLTPRLGKSRTPGTRTFEDDQFVFKVTEQ